MMFPLLKAFTPTISEGNISSKSHVALKKGNLHVMSLFRLSIMTKMTTYDKMNSRARVLKGVIFKERR